jgi:peptide methionine sulfoxide reductase MsrB
MIVGLNALYFKSFSKTSFRFLRMDDETARYGIKDDLTTKDDYLANRFVKLSRSYYDLTPMTTEEKENYKNSIQHDDKKRTFRNSSYLGENQKGIYVCVIGGLPLFSSGSIVKDLCNSNFLTFSEPCDPEHVALISKEKAYQLLAKASDSFLNHDIVFDNGLTCTRTGILVGLLSSSHCVATADQYLIPLRYTVFSNRVKFLSLDDPWPIECQPENIWGTEGQYVAWKHIHLNGQGDR